jgi:dihydrofolate reductase
MEYAIIAAVSENMVIGNQGEIPWYVPEDLKRFKKLTLDKPVIMGRKTYESIIERLGHPLPQRANIVLTSRDVNYPEYVEVARSVEQSIEKAELYGNLAYVIGGEEVYREFLPIVNRMDITHVKKEFKGDAYFPKVNWDEWELKEQEDHEEYSFITYLRK